MIYRCDMYTKPLDHTFCNIHIQVRDSHTHTYISYIYRCTTVKMCTKPLDRAASSSAQAPSAPTAARPGASACPLNP